MAKVLVISPEGKRGFIPEENLQVALQRGFKQAPQQEVETNVAGDVQQAANVATQSFLESIPGFKQVGAGVAALGQEAAELVGAEPEKDIADRYKEALNKINELSGISRKEAPVAAFAGDVAGTIATIGAMGGKRAVAAGITGAKSLSNALDAQQDFDQALGNVAKDVGIHLGLDLGLAGLGTIATKLGPKAKDAAVKIIAKVADLTKRVKEGKLTANKAREAAEEVLKKAPKLFPTIRRMDKAVANRLNQTEKQLTQIYKQADDLAGNAKVINKDQLVSRLRQQASEAGKQLDTATQSGLNKLAKDIQKSGDDLSVMEAWEASKKFGKKAFKEGAQLSNEAAAATRSAIKEQLDDVVTKVDTTGNLINRLRSTNKEVSSLLTAAKPLARKAALKSSSLLPGTLEIIPGVVDPRLAALLQGIRTARVLGPGVAAKTLSGVGAAGQKLREVSRPSARIFSAISGKVRE